MSQCLICGSGGAIEELKYDYELEYRGEKLFIPDQVIHHWCEYCQDGIVSNDTHMQVSKLIHEINMNYVMRELSSPPNKSLDGLIKRVNDKDSVICEVYINKDCFYITLEQKLFSADIDRYFKISLSGDGVLVVEKREMLPAEKELVELIETL